MVRRLRRGFTLVELLVVIAIIGMLVAILLPAVQAAREAGRRSVCISTQRQLAIGVQGFEGNRGRFPGWHEVLGGKDASWMVAILPNMDKQALYDLWNDPNIPANDPRLLPFIKDMRCLSNPNPDNQSPHNSYIANAGFLPRAADLALTPLLPISSNPLVEGPNDGVFVNASAIYGPGPVLLSAASRVTASDVAIDGITNTALFSESLLAGSWALNTINNKYPLASTPQYPVGSNLMVFLYAQEPNYLVDPGPPLGGPTAMPVPLNWTPDMRINGNRRTLQNWSQLGVEHIRPSSNHPSVVIMAFADAHTIILHESVEYRVYQQLLTTYSQRSNTPHRQYPYKDADLNQ